MTIARTSETVGVWIDGGVPVRLVWRGVRYAVTDSPTPLRQDVNVPGMTHPISRRLGFRMQVTDQDGASEVVDIHEAVSGHWTLVAVYD